MSAELLAMLAGGILSLAFSYIPGLKDKWSLLDETYKRLIMAGLLVVVSGAIFGLSCAGWAAAWGINIPCSVEGLQGLLTTFVLALIANQSTFVITKG